MEDLLSLDEIKHIEIEILDYVVHLCDEHHLRYFLMYGTLIGAVRHQGFIPWDDDIDITMPRKDYQQLMDILLKEKNEKYVLLCEKTKGYTYPFAKVVDTQTRILEESIDDFEHNGIWIDIFPYDGMQSKMHYKLCCLLNKCRAAAIYKEFPKGRGGSYWQWKICRIIGYQFFASFYNRICQKYDYETSDEVAFMALPTEHCPRRCMEQCVKMEFEGKTYDVPTGYDEILTLYYGDYMQLPPENQRVTHQIKAVRLNL